MKRTPGFWHYDQWGHICAGEKIIGIAYEREMDELNFADLPQMANAKMMAAAPQMLAIIKGLMSNDTHDMFRAKLRADELIKEMQVNLESND